MDKLNSRDLLAANAGQQTTRKLTESDLELVSKFKKMCRDFSFQPPCECQICLHQYRTKDQQDLIHWCYVGHLEDPAHLAQSYTKSINDIRGLLYQKILTSELSILKRWRAGAAKRKEFLEQAQPGIYPVAHPLIDIVSHGQMKLNDQRSHRASYLLPYVNLEDLSTDSANLIRLLHHRISYSPDEWVHFDNGQLQPPWKQGAFAEKSADGCITMRGLHYGKWKDFDPAAVHNGDAYGAPRGLMILEAQQLLMSFLLKLVHVILKDANPSNPQENQAIGVAAATTTNFDLTGCSKWIRFIEADQRRDCPWLSFAALYSQEPYSRPPHFDIDAMIDIVKDKTQEAQDELWLLQTDLGYFYELLKRHEREWFDSVPGVKELNVFSPKEKMDNIGFLMTVKVLIQARDWQWLLEACLTTKRLMEDSKARNSEGGSLASEYESSLCGLEYFLRNAQIWYQDSLSRLFRKSQAFQSIMEVKATGKDQQNNWALGFGFRDYSQLYQKDRLGWCLYNLTKDPKDLYTFERSVVLQQLEKFLETCPRQEIERIDQEMYKCISHIAAVERMLSILGLHRPSTFLTRNPFHLSRSIRAFQVHAFLDVRPTKMTCADMDLSSALESSTNFRMPTGRRDEHWLAQRDRAYQNLSDLWKKARHAYQQILRSSTVPQKLIEPELAMMKQGDSPENKARLDLERQQILGRLEAVKRKAMAESATPPKDFASAFNAQHNLPDYRTQQPAKEKTKTRPDITSASAVLHAKYAAAFANLALDEETDKAEKPPPTLYTFKRNSTEFQTLSSMFPDRSKGIEEAGKTMDWLDFVSTMKALGFTAEHRGGSSFTFKGAIRLPHDPSNLHKRSIGVHMPHPSTEMGPILLQSLGRRCNRRFGWQRGNFAAEEKGVEQGISDVRSSGRGSEDRYTGIYRRLQP